MAWLGWKIQKELNYLLRNLELALIRRLKKLKMHLNPSTP
jgi:hypothetical protein